jgi:hypothetical protein
MHLPTFHIPSILCDPQLEAAGEQQVERVYTVVLSEQGLDCVPAWLSRFPSLRSVDLGFNRIGPTVGTGLDNASTTLQELRCVSITLITATQ